MKRFAIQELTDLKAATPNLTLPQIMISYPENLPITAKKEEIIRAIGSGRVTIVIGDTGSGKTTQLPKMCLELDPDGQMGLIGCTQPRRLAAVMAARRIARELGEEAGNRVGYKIRFEEVSGPRQRIKIMTDGVLLREAQHDPFLKRYGTIIIDEAHERSLNIDFLLGIIKRLIPRRPDLKVIITSATLDALKFSQFFDGAPIIEVSGRLYDVETHYRPMSLLAPGDSLTDAVLATTDEIWANFPPGNILIFLPTEADIREACLLLAPLYEKDALILPFFARLSRSRQDLVFRPAKIRKIIVATNIAETSLTIGGIRYVIDSGLARLSQYNPRTRTVGLPVRHISAGSADQRKGRCGRERDGVCFRLYSEEEYERLPLYTPPEITRTNLAEVILRMLHLGLGEPSSFPFLDPPQLKYIHDGLATLEELQAIDFPPDPIACDNRKEPAGRRQRSSPRLTREGKIMARLPLDPRLAKMLLAARNNGCLREMLIIAAALTIPDPREASWADKDPEPDYGKDFRHEDSDLLGLLKLYGETERLFSPEISGAARRRYCQDHGLSYPRMREWRDIVAELGDILEEHGFRMNSVSPDNPGYYEKIHRAVVGGYLSQIAIKKKKNVYQGTFHREIHLSPGSDLINHKGAGFIVAPELIETTRLYARRAAKIERPWVEEAGRHLCRRTYLNPRWDRRRREVVADEQVTLHDLVLVAGRTVSYGPIAPGEAKMIFIREALLAEEEPLDLPFIRHNLTMKEKARQWEDKLRRRDLLLTDEELIPFFDARLPEIYNEKSLAKLIRDRAEDSFLRLEEKDFLRPLPETDPSDYPHEISLSGETCQISYHFNEGAADDGATLKLPLGMIASLSSPLPEKLIPGLWRLRLWQLLSGLPKSHRKKLEPLEKTHELLFREFEPREGWAQSALSSFIASELGIEIPPDAWPAKAGEDHLRLRIALTDEAGTEVMASRERTILKEQLEDLSEHPVLTSIKATWERKQIKEWDFPDLPQEIPLEANGNRLGFVYPALALSAGEISLKIFLDPEAASLSHTHGLTALFHRHLSTDWSKVKKHLPIPREHLLWISSWNNASCLNSQLLEKIIRDNAPGNIRRKEDFLAQANKIKLKMDHDARSFLNATMSLWKTHFEVTRRIKQLLSSHLASKAATTYLDRLKEEITVLFPPDFVVRYHEDRLNDLVRYLNGIVLRAERGIANLPRALEKTKQVDIFSSFLKERAPSGSLIPDSDQLKAFDELFWMIEEYKISLFAQELKTKFPVSPRRLEGKIQAIKNM